MEKPIAAETYSKEYFTSVCFQEFEKSAGKKLPERLRKSLEIGEVKEKEMILDIGCGRGELVMNSAAKGAKAIGIDYAIEALKLARKGIEKNRVEKNALVLQADAKKLPFQNNSFTMVFLIDIVEHLHPWEVDELMQEVQRVLKPRGKIVIETSPNSFVAKPLYGIGKLFGIQRGWNEKVHVNEQNYFKLRRTLKKHGFKGKVWLEMVPLWFKAAAGEKKFSGAAEALEKILKIKAVKRILELFPISIFFCTHVWAKARKE